MRKWIVRIRYIIFMFIGYLGFIYCQLNPEFVQEKMLWPICFLMMGVIDTYIIISRIRSHIW